MRLQRPHWKMGSHHWRMEASNLGEVLIRCNNVLYLRGVPEEEES